MWRDPMVCTQPRGVPVTESLSIAVINRFSPMMTYGAIKKETRSKLGAKNGMFNLISHGSEESEQGPD